MFFDVDFTLIAPGPLFQASGYERVCARHGLRVDPAAFGRAVERAASVLEVDDLVHDTRLFLEYTQRIVVEMGGRGDGLAACAQEIYDAWACCEHFTLYEDVHETFAELARRGIRIGLISNTHRCLDTLRRHFALDGVAAVVSSADHGFMKPHPSIFHRALDAAGVAPRDAMMVGDSLRQDVHGARAVGMRALLLDRHGPDDEPRERRRGGAADDVPVIRRLTELLDHLRVGVAT